MTIVTDLPV